MARLATARPDLFSPLPLSVSFFLSVTFHPKCGCCCLTKYYTDHRIQYTTYGMAYCHPWHSILGATVFFLFARSLQSNPAAHFLGSVYLGLKMSLVRTRHLQMWPKVRSGLNSLLTVQVPLEVNWICTIKKGG